MARFARSDSSSTSHARAQSVYIFLVRVFNASYAQRCNPLPVTDCTVSHPQTRNISNFHSDYVEDTTMEPPLEDKKYIQRQNPQAMGCARTARFSRPDCTTSRARTQSVCLFSVSVQCTAVELTHLRYHTHVSNAHGWNSPIYDITRIGTYYVEFLQ